MKQLACTFLVLLTAFCGIWIYRSRTPVDMRPEDAEAEQVLSWWENNDLPQADPEWVLDPEIPANYIPVPGKSELYMIIDDEGKIQEYAKRTQNEDGSWMWEYNINPNIPENYEAVPGLENVYKVVNEDGSVTYYKYIRNDDDTFAFVEVDENGEEIKEEEDDNDFIPENYVRIKGNVYGVYNEHGVCIGYKERKFDEETGKYYWVDAEKPVIESPKPSVTQPTLPQLPSQGQPQTPNIPSNPSQGQTQTPTNPTTPKPDTYESVETHTETQISGGWIVTTETTITKVYSADGKLISTKKDGPHEVSREPVGDKNTNAPNPALIASSLSGEYARVSVGLNYKNSLANEVLSIINAERVSAGLPGLVMNTSSNAYLLAAVKASDMAIYDHSDYDSPMYGTLSDMKTRFGVSGGSSSERMWRSGSGKTAEEIASRLMMLDGGKITSSSISDVGIVIVSKNGYYYIDLVYFY